MPANYDKIARIYDLLSRLVFGSHIVQAQVAMLQYVSPASSILIIGGGTGWILEKFAEKYSDGLEIDYVESSGQMMALAQKRNYKSNQVNFIALPIEDYAIARTYDVIITPFIFDNFKLEKLEKVFAKLDQSLKDKGLWLYADFVYDRSASPLWQKILLRIMYLFFRITTGIETQKLISLDKYFASDYLIRFETHHYFRFIRSVVYQKK